jgi:hypothetical protein
MEKSNKMKPCAVLIAGFAALLFVFALSLSGRGGRSGEECGIPDAVSSISDGEKCCLTVVANSSQISDEEAFAREVVRMCMENSFRSLRFSTDIGERPAVLEIDVYLQKKDVGEMPPVFRIRAESKGTEGVYDSENQMERYQIFIE